MSRDSGHDQIVAQLRSYDPGAAEVPRLVHRVRRGGRLAGAISRLSAQARACREDEAGRGLSSLDRCTYAAGISVRVNPAVVAGSGCH